MLTLLPGFRARTSEVTERTGSVFGIWFSKGERKQRQLHTKKESHENPSFMDRKKGQNTAKRYA